MFSCRSVFFVAIVSFGVLSAEPASAQKARVKRVAPAGFVSLPFSASDSLGNQWMIYQNGMLQQRGNTPVMSQGAMLLVNGENVQQNNNNNRAGKDEKTGEIIFDGMTASNVTITRRILVRADPGYVRYIDVFKNSQPQPQTLDVQFQTRINFGVTTSQPVPDPTGNDRVLGWAAQTQANRAVLIMTAGRGSKTNMTIVPQPDTNMAQSSISLTVPANAEVALMSVYGVTPTLDAGVTFMTTAKDSDLLKDCSNEIRREIINFNTSDQFIGDREVLRGTTLDVIELRGSSSAGGNGAANDQLRGTLQESTYTLRTFYGDVTLPAEQVIGMISVGQYRPRQLVVTADGQVFGGTLGKITIGMALSSGQVVEVPLAQISRIGYRKRSSEGENPELPKLGVRPSLLLRSGDRIAIETPTGPIDFLSRYGALHLPVAAVNAIAFQSEDNSVHTLYLTDGSHLSGLLESPELTVTLASPPATQPSTTDATTPTAAPPTAPQRITIPIAAIARLQLTAIAADPDETTPQMQLANGDLLTGMITGQIKVDTAFDTLTVNGSEIHALSHPRDAGNDVQITLWDQTRISGSVSAVQIPCKLTSGPEIAAPVALIDSYTQPQPMASASMVQQIESTVKDLSADDWKTREKAEAQLISMGPVVLPQLRQLTAAQPPEAQQRIEAIVRKLTEKKGTAGTATPPGIPATD